jgi:hypothetical protein
MRIDPGCLKICASRRSTAFNYGQTDFTSHPSRSGGPIFTSIFGQVRPAGYTDWGGREVIRRLRIAVSVFFAVVAVALAALWVRSYSRCDMLAHDGMTHSTFGSNWGYAYLIRMDAKSMQNQRRQAGWRHSAMESHERPAKFEWVDVAPVFQITVPYWFLVLMAVVLSCSPWTPPRVSVRTFLIATTLVALVLGLALYAGR